MARCPYCDHVLEDTWLKRMGAALMGKAKGANKARDSEAAKVAAEFRWFKEKQAKKKRRKKS